MKERKKNMIFTVIFFLLITVGAGFYFKDNILCITSSKSLILNVGFDESLCIRKIGKGHIMSSPHDKKCYEVVKKCWNQNVAVEIDKEYKIPKIIHQIMVNQELNSKIEKKYAQSWKIMHPSWEVRKWGKEDIENLSPKILDLINKTECQNEKLDLIRCAILEKFGGVCVGVEFECLKPIDELNRRFHFYAGLESPYIKQEEGRVLHISSQFVGSSPDHPILNKWFENMKQRIMARRGISASTVGDKGGNLINFTLTDAVEFAGMSDGFVNIVFPPTYAYPVSPRWINKFHKSNKISYKKWLISIMKLKNISNVFSIKSRVPLFSKVQPESFAINHLGGSWKWEKKEFKKFKIKREELSQMEDL